ncbi:hypothetical protein CRUP_023453, partial [Coryphaenoides rupestris]
MYPSSRRAAEGAGAGAPLRDVSGERARTEGLARRACSGGSGKGPSWTAGLDYPPNAAGEHGLLALNPWLPHRGPGSLSRVKRDWIIPPIRVLENSKQVPEDLVQIKSDKIFTSQVIYKLEGPGVDQEPKNLFEIDDKSGIIRSKRPLDREKHKSFTLKAFALSPSGERLENPTTIEIMVLDQNDNRPSFIQNQFTGSVAEFSVP